MISSEAYYLYVLYSSSINQYYIGVSNNPEQRVQYHNTAHKGWTRRGRPWGLVYMKSFSSKRDAMKWEKWVKLQKKRSIIKKIIANEFDWTK